MLVKVVVGRAPKIATEEFARASLKGEQLQALLLLRTPSPYTLYIVADKWSFVFHRHERGTYTPPPLSGSGTQRDEYPTTKLKRDKLVDRQSPKMPGKC